VPKLFLAVSDGKPPFHKSIVDLDTLPAGVDSSKAMHPWNQGVEITAWIERDIPRAIAVIQDIANANFTPQALAFLSELASFWENLPPAAEEKHAFLGGMPGNVDFIRTSEQVASDLYAKL
jgi:hypothetical protein